MQFMLLNLAVMKSIAFKYTFTFADLLQEQMRSRATVNKFTYVSKSVHVNEA